MNNHILGFTLIEVLVSILLIGIVLAALMSFFGQTSKLSSQSETRSALQQETLNAQQLMASRLREAWYIFPVGTSLNLTGNLRKNPTNNHSSNWIIGTHPIVAMILPPTQNGGPCQKSSRQFCWRAFAYYPVQRSIWIQATTNNAGQPTSSNPGADPTNDAKTWVLVELRKTLYGFTPSSYPPTTLPNINTGSDANLLADYIAPSNASTAPYTMFRFEPNTTGSLVRGIQSNLALSRMSQGKNLRLPDATGTYQLAAYPSNLGKMPAN